MNQENCRSRADALLAAVLLLVALLPAACEAPAPVVQGKVVAVDAKTLRVQDETRPDTAIDLDITAAEISNTPRVGDIVRVVYRNIGQTHRALAVMNLTRQPQAEGRNR